MLDSDASGPSRAASSVPASKPSVSQNGYKNARGGLDLLNAFQLILHRTTVATVVILAPGDN